MFGTLLESRAVRQHHTRGSLVSMLFHCGVIAAAVAATARETLPTPMPTRMFDVSLRVPDPPPTARVATTAAASAVQAAPQAFALRIPAIIPVGIPPVDLAATPTPVDFTQGRIARDDLRCQRDCGTLPATDRDGNHLWSAAELVMRLREDPVPPRYPEGLRRAGIEGSVLVKFIVDTTGRVDMGSIEVVRSTHEAFTAAVRETLGRLRFQPSSMGDAKVRAAAMMPFQFTLR